MNTSPDTARLENAVIGCLIGTAVGDALGLPMEGLTRQRQRRMYPDLDRYHILFRRGMISDDTEHACMTAQALAVSSGDPVLFTKSLSRQLKLWLLGLPAGIGYATLRSILRLWIGFPCDRSGVFSAGNGPAMRSPILGVCYGHDPDRVKELVRASTRLTHTDPKAEFGALAVALATYLAAGRESVSPEEYCAELDALLGPDGHEMSDLARKAAASAGTGASTEEFADSLGLSRGVTGYIYHTVPAVLYAWFRHPDDYASAVKDIIACGGDTDTTAAILGGIVGARVGRGGIPGEWVSGLAEWPRSVDWMERLGRAVTDSVCSGNPTSPPGLLVPGLLLRNVVFLVVVLLHGFRRLLPPY